MTFNGNSFNTDNNFNVKLQILVIYLVPVKYIPTYSGVWPNLDLIKISFESLDFTNYSTKNV